MRVLKFGGTSIGSVDMINKVVNLINLQNSNIIVLSAFSNVTNILSDFIKQVKLQNNIVSLQLISLIEQRHLSIIYGLISSKKFQKIALDKLNEALNILTDINNKEKIEAFEEKLILAQGELLSAMIIYIYALEKEIDLAYIPALKFMKTDINQEPDFDFIKENLLKELELRKGCKAIITNGFICRNYRNEIDNLGRGASDYTATIIGNILNTEKIEIWTDIDGIHNNDPRFVEHTEAIRHLSYEEAGELAYFGAKILHPASITPAQINNIPVIIKNTISPDDLGTVISSYTIEKGIKAVAAKDHITTIKIKSGRMMQAYGFLRKIFEVFEKHKTSVDMLTTSEISVAMTIDNTNYLAEIIEELSLIGEVEVQEHQAIICIIGAYNTSKSLIQTIIDSLDSISIQMISYGSSKNNISFVINSNQKIEALNILNQSILKNSRCLLSN